MWQGSHRCSSLELRLGPPGEESLIENMKKVKKERDESESPLTLGYFSTQKISTSHTPGPRGDAVFHHQHNPHQANAKASSFPQLQSSPQNMAVMGKDESQSQPCCVDLQDAEKNPFLPSSALPNRSHKRSAPSPVVGWPPIRSFRKNLASGSGSSSKSSPGSQHVVPDDKVASNKVPIIGNSNSSKGLFVKINMDRIPIGRKVDIDAYDNYEKLSSAVDELFRGLLAEINLSHIVSSQCCSAQRDSSASGIHNKQEEGKAITGSLIGSGEYTLVYEDNEGDKMLVGDVPWHMFVSTVKRLRVLKSSDLPAFNLVSKQRLDTPLDSAIRNEVDEAV